MILSICVTIQTKFIKSSRRVKVFFLAKASWGPMRAVKYDRISTAPLGRLELKIKLSPVAELIKS